MGIKKAWEERTIDEVTLDKAQCTVKQGKFSQTGESLGLEEETQDAVARSVIDMENPSATATNNKMLLRYLIGFKPQGDFVDFQSLKAFAALAQP